MKYTEENDRYFYAGDVFERDSTVCAYNCTDSGTLTATASINSDMLKGLSGTVTALSASGGDWSPVTLTYADAATDVYTTKDTIGILSINLDDVTSRIGALEKSFAELAKTMKNNVSSIDRSAFKTLKPKYEVL